MKYTYSLLFLAICLLPFISVNAFADPIITSTYLKDGKKDVNGEMVYKVDYVTMQSSLDSLVEKYESTENSIVTVTDRDIILDYAFKIPNNDNP